MKAKLKKNWLAAGAGVLAGAFALTGVLTLSGNLTTASADEAPKALYYVDAGNLSPNSDGHGISGRNHYGGQAGYPLKDATAFMDAYGLEFGNGSTGLYNSVTDKLYGADEATEKEWGFTIANDEKYGFGDGWRTVATSSGHSIKDGFKTSRWLGDNDSDNISLTYKFEVDDNTTPLKITYGTRAGNRGDVQNAGDFNLVINGGTLSDTTISTTPNDDKEYTFTKTVDEGNQEIDIVGQQEGSKYYVSVTFNKPSGKFLFISWILVTTADYELRDLYTYEQVAKKGDCASFTVYSNDKELATATLDETNQAIINNAAYGESVKVTATIDGVVYKNLSVTVIPETTKYFVNAGEATVVAGAPFIADVAYDAGTGYGYTTGTVKAGEEDKPDGKRFPGSGQYLGGSFDRSVRVDVTSINYQFDNLESGKGYGVILGVSDYWEQWANNGRVHDMTVNGGDKVSTSAPNTGNNYSGTWSGVNPGIAYGVANGDGELTVSISCETDELVIAYIIVFKAETVTFDANGGEEVAPKAFGTSLSLENVTTTRTGYTFDGWYTAAEGGDVVTEVTTSQTVYAHWTAKTYDVNLEYGEHGTGDATASVTYGEIPQLPDPTVTTDGKVFVGWFTTADDDSETGVRVDNVAWTYDENNKTLYARYADKTSVDVTLHCDDATYNGTTVNLTVGDEVEGLPELTKEGYDFVGWFTQENGEGTPYANGDIWRETDATDLYAHFTKKSYTVSFNTNGGSTVGSETVEHGEKVTKPADPTRDGYTFAGWYKDADCTEEFDFTTETITEATTIYAKWTANSTGGGDEDPDPTPEPKKGCGSVIGVGSALVGTVTLAAAAFVAIKKKKD